MGWSEREEATDGCVVHNSPTILCRISLVKKEIATPTPTSQLDCGNRGIEICLHTFLVIFQIISVLVLR